MRTLLLEIAETIGAFLILAIIFLSIAAWIIRRCFEFSQQLRYLNREIRRSCGAERKFWKRRRRRLWLSLLPFFRV